jgi:outer membrane protein
MQKKLTGLSLAATLIPTLIAPQLANADVLSVYGGIESWRADPTGTFGDSQLTSASFNFDDQTATNFYLGFEHPMPLIPNLKLRKDSIDLAGQATVTGFVLGGKPLTGTVDSTVKLEQTDLILYWELLDLDLFSFDVGFNAKYIEADLSADDGTTRATDSFKGWVPMAYLAAEVSLPGLPLSLWTEGSYISYSGDTFYDARAAIKYTLIDSLPMDLSLSLGYRAFELKVDDLDDVFADMDFTGYYAGMELRF